MLPVPQLLPVYSAKSVRERGQSYFVDAEGRRLPSVTTILNATKPLEARQALMNWRDRVGAEEAKRISGNASRRGTQTHKHIKHYLLSQDVPRPETVQPYWDSLSPVLQRVDQVRLVESCVFHYDLGYAGKIDCVASYSGTPCILDWKTADRPRKSLDRLNDAPLQLAAYYSAFNFSYADQGIELEAAAIVVAVPESPAELFWLEADTLKQYWQQWERRVAEFNRRFRRG